MERLPGHAAPADLAAHFAGAEIWEKALEYAALAGEQAREMDAPRSAAAHFTLALEAAAALHLEPPAALLQARGEALETIGDFEAARSDFEAALASGRAAADSSVEWQALLSLGMLWSSRDYSRAGDYLREALDCARAINDPGRVAQSLNRAGNWHLNSGRPEEARRLHEEALTNFGELNDRRGRAQTLDLLGMAVNLSGDTAAAVACYEQAAALFRDLGDRMGLASTLGNLAAAPAEHLTFPVAMPPSYRPEECAREALALAREIGWRAGEAYALANLATLLATRGEYKEALACARQAEATVEEIEHHQWRTAMTFGSGMVCFDLLYLAGARRHLEAALAQARSLGSSYWERHIGGILAWTLVLVGELERAEQIIEDLFPREERSGLLWQMEVRVRCELALAKGDAPGALAYADRLLDAAQRSVPGAVVAAIGLPRGAALAALGRDEEAEVVLRAALDACVTQPLRWRLHVALGRFYQARGRRLDADGEFAAARAIVDQLATLLPDEPVPEFFGASPRVEFLRGAATIIPRQRPVTPLRAARDAAGGLTARERDVAALIARGCSNREIADALVIGHRTVQTHVENIFAKLGCSSRAEVAVWAAAKGLLNHTGRT